MEFFNSAVTTLQTIFVGLFGALCFLVGINLLEGYGQDNPASKSQGVKQLGAGGGVALIGATLVPLLSGLLG
ncbi:Maff2 family mobile element protein [Megasphaera sp.]|uniref:Maff2 family mobile element protein n=1 Tax=Megasphaera sp. TaxID=2023260 RepID=UPI0025BB4C21|nr:Maff2 family protein [Megasphaera sp.]